MKTKVKRIKAVKDPIERARWVAKFRLTGRSQSTGERFNTIFTGTRPEAEERAASLERK